METVRRLKMKPKKHRKKARILPTRNGNYKVFLRNRSVLVHGSYLQGMETFEKFGTRIRIHLHGSYLQGMETYLAL